MSLNKDKVELIKTFQEVIEKAGYEKPPPPGSRAYIAIFYAWRSGFQHGYYSGYEIGSWDYEREDMDMEEFFNVGDISYQCMESDTMNSGFYDMSDEELM